MQDFMLWSKGVEILKDAARKDFKSALLKLDIDRNKEGIYSLPSLVKTTFSRL
jgi:hypothetical protein